jgi:hypothetical protein
VNGTFILHFSKRQASEAWEPYNIIIHISPAVSFLTSVMTFHFYRLFCYTFTSLSKVVSDLRLQIWSSGANFYSISSSNLVSKVYFCKLAYSVRRPTLRLLDNSVTQVKKDEISGECSSNRRKINACKV